MNKKQETGQVWWPRLESQLRHGRAALYEFKAKQSLARVEADPISDKINK